MTTKIKIANLQQNRTLRMHDEPIAGNVGVIGKTWNGCEFEVLEKTADNQWLYVGGWISASYTQPVDYVDENIAPYLTKNLPDNTRWAILNTDNIAGESLPRMLNPEWDWQNQNPSPTYPCTVALRDANGNKRPSVAIDNDYWTWTIALNAMNNENALAILLNPGSGWINKIHPEQILTAGTWVIVEETTPQAIRIKTLPWNWGHGSIDPVVFNHKTALPFVNHFVAIFGVEYNPAYFYVDISSGGSGRAESILTPVLSREPDDAWILKTDNWADNRYWFPPEVPFSVTVTDVDGLTIRSTPEVLDTNIINYIQQDVIIPVYAYHPNDTGVWGKVADDAYINLQYLSYPGDRYPWYGTNWRPDELAIPAPRPTYDY